MMVAVSDHVTSVVQLSGGDIDGEGNVGRIAQVWVD